MEYDLTQGLRNLSHTPPVPPLPAEPVVRRVHRRRAIRTAAVGMASAAVIVGAAVVVYAAPWNPPPPAETPTPVPTIEPTPDPTPEPSPEPTEEPADEDPPIVALTTTGDLVLLDPVSGALLRSHPAVADESPFGGSRVTTDQTFAFVVRDGEVNRVDLASGGVEVVGSGVAPAVSPDGRLLAYIEQDELGDPSRSTVWLVDQASGAHHSLDPIAATELELPRPSWSRDGATLYLSYGLEPDIVTVPVAADGAPLTDAVTTLRAPRAEDGYATEFWDLATGLPDGWLAYVSTPEAYDIPAAEISVRRLDPATGASSRIEELSGVEVVDLAAQPQGEALLAVVATREDGTVRYTLVRWDPLGGLRTLADDIVAVAW